ncbi:MAG: RidA family protein [Hyphomicrobiales bacterium]
MALTPVFTQNAPPPFSKYSQAVEVPEGSKLVFVSGQVGVDKDGNLASCHEGQHEQVWRNILAILAESGLGPHHIADVTAYVTNAEGVGLFRSVRDKFLDEAEPASTLLHISGLAHPDWVVEVAVVACGPAEAV